MGQPQPPSLADRGAVAPRPKQPFLRRGAGWEARVAAAKDGRRYVPPGGAIKDYAKEEGAPRLPSLAKLLSAPKPAAARRGRRGAVEPAATQAAAAAPSPQQAQRARQAEAAGPPLQQRARHLAPASRRALSQERPAARQAHVPGGGHHQLPATAQAAQPALTDGSWAMKMLAGAAATARGPVQPSLAAGEEAELAEFRVLESQVLCEVGNTSQPSSPAHCPRPGKKTAAGSHRASQAGRVTRWADVGGMQQEQLEPAGLAELEEEEEEDVFQSDDEGNVQDPCDGARRKPPEARTAAPSPSRLPRPPPHLPPARREHQEDEGEEDEEGGLEAQSSFLPGTAYAPPGPLLVDRFFGRAAAAAPLSPQLSAPLPASAQAPQEARPQQHAAGAAAMVDQLQQEIVQVQEERARVARLRTQLEEGAARLQQEQSAFELRRVQEAARFEAERGEELRKLQRDRRVLEKQSRAMMKIPSQRDREEVKAVEVRGGGRGGRRAAGEGGGGCGARAAVSPRAQSLVSGKVKPTANAPPLPRSPGGHTQALLEQEKKSGRAREARHKLQVERLRQQLLELQQKMSEQREEIAYLEKQRLEGRWGAAAGAAAGDGPATQGAAARASRAAAGGATGAAAASGAASEQGRQATAAPRWAAAGRRVVVRHERRGVASQAGPAASNQPAPADPADCEDDGLVEDVHPEVDEVDEAEALGSQAWGTLEAGDAQAACESEGEGMAELLDEAEVLLHSTSPAVRVAAHWAQAGMPVTSARALPLPERNPSQKQLASNAGVGRHDVDGPASTAVSVATAAPMGAQASQGSAAPAADAMSKAAAALDRFNQLRQSLSHHEQKQQQLASQRSSLHTSPSAGTGAGAEASDGARAQPAADDLRRLGRMLTASSSAAPSPPEQLLPAPQQQAPCSSAAPPAPGSPADRLVSSQQHTDGRVDRAYASGLREQLFANGSVKRTLPDGHSVTHFANGDVKRVLPSGATEYWYAAVDSWQVSHPGPPAVEVYYFSSGQVEAHHEGGVREVVFADGAARRVLPDGRELPLTAPHLSAEIRHARPVGPAGHGLLGSGHEQVSVW
eukprot:scaffold20.g7816.t1